MSIESRLLPIVAITGSSLMVGCGGSGPSCGSYGSYGSYGSFGSYGSLGASRGRPRSNRSARADRMAGAAPAAPGPAACAAPAGADGYYEGTLTDASTQSENPVVAIIAENGDGRMSGQNGAYYHLNVAESGINVSGSYYGYSQVPGAPIGSQSTSGTVSAVVTAPGLSGTLTSQVGGTGNLLLNFDNVYNLGSSLTTLVGTWNYSMNGFNLTAQIQADGTFSANDSNGCSYSGAFGLIDANFNAYSDRYVRSCNGVNLTFTGLATYLPATGNAVPARIKMLSDDNAGDFLVADFQ